MPEARKRTRAAPNPNRGLKHHRRRSTLPAWTATQCRRRRLHPRSRLLTCVSHITTHSEGAAHSHIDHVFITDIPATAVDEYAIDDNSVLGIRYGDERGLDHSVLVADLDVRSLLGIGVDKGKATVTKRRTAIKYSDKKRVERFREYATHEFDRRNMDGVLYDLIGDLALGTALRDRGRGEREADEGAPWEALRGRRGKHPDRGT